MIINDFSNHGMYQRINILDLHNIKSSIDLLQDLCEVNWHTNMNAHQAVLL